MGQFTAEILVSAPKAKVWKVLADIGNAYRWNPGIASSYCLSESEQGDGTTRHSDTYQVGHYMRERVTEWREGEGYKIEIYDSTLPLKSAVFNFSIEDRADYTIVRVTPRYELKYGVFGDLLDKLLAERQYRKGIQELLAGLKYHVETGKLVSDRVPQVVR